MIVSLAVYSGDATSALKLLRWINELGGIGHRHLLLATTQAVDPRLLLDTARQGWRTVEHMVIVSNQEKKPWPAGNNDNFMSVAKHLAPRNEAFFFMESDVLPLRSTWLDELEAEYLSIGKPFMGDVHGMVDATGATVPGSDHMNGSGIYPPKALSYLPTSAWMDTALAVQPWDVALRHEMLWLIDGNGGFRPGPDNGRVSICHPTRKICFCWRSKAYRIDPSGRWACEVEPSSVFRQLDFDQHVLHHGCKDDSLLNLLQERLREARAPKLPASQASSILVEDEHVDEETSAPPAPAPSAVPHLCQEPGCALPANHAGFHMTAENLEKVRAPAAAPARPVPPASFFAPEKKPEQTPPAAPPRKVAHRKPSRKKNAAAAAKRRGAVATTA